MRRDAERCSVAYGRKTCEPFCLGIEGARCELDADHAGEHETRIVSEFGETPDQDVLKVFKFTVSE